MRVVRSLLLALGATAVTVGVGVVVLGEDPPAPRTPLEEPQVALTLTDLDTTQLVVQRADFCEGVPDDVVTDALGGEAVAEAAYGNGDRAKVAGQVRDISHEFSCAWRGPDGTVARAWVFAPPVPPTRAETLISDARTQEGCAADGDALAYGVPSLALVCQDRGTRARSYRGLFGDAWLTCQLVVPSGVSPGVHEERTGRWCAGVASSARTTD